MKSAHVILTSMLRKMISIVISKLVALWIYQNEKILLQKDTNEIGSKMFLWSKLLKTLYQELQKANPIQFKIER